MFRNISELLVRAADLAEAEGRALRYHSVRVGTALGLVLAAALLLVGSLVAILAGAHMALRHRLGPEWAWLISGVVGLGFAALLLWLAKGMVSSDGVPGNTPSRASTREPEGADAEGSTEGHA